MKKAGRATTPSQPETRNPMQEHRGQDITMLTSHQSRGNLSIPPAGDHAPNRAGLTGKTIPIAQRATLTCKGVE